MKQQQEENFCRISGIWTTVMWTKENIRPTIEVWRTIFISIILYHSVLSNRTLSNIVQTFFGSRFEAKFNVFISLIFLNICIANKFSEPNIFTNYWIIYYFKSIFYNVFGFSKFSKFNVIFHYYELGHPKKKCFDFFLIN